MLSLDRGRAMAHLTANLEALGFTWAYRVIDARSFGIPQRRPRVYLVASKNHDPRQVVFADEHGEIPVDDDTEPKVSVPYGFYWTEGLRGVGWCGNSVPPIKGGSALGIPSPPAVWISRTGEIGTIDLRDAERLQGFPANWTKPAEAVPGARASARWRLVGNAVCVAVPAWIGGRLRRPGKVTLPWREWKGGGPWPKAAWGYGGKVFEVTASRYPVQRQFRGIEEFLRFPLKPLSLKATAGYLSRAKRCWWYVSPRFLADVERHLAKMEAEAKPRRSAA
jgi:DNA (cytosine-5)-methyltransferase 1